MWMLTNLVLEFQPKPINNSPWEQVVKRMRTHIHTGDMGELRSCKVIRLEPPQTRPTIQGDASVDSCSTS